jgi:hypothetical protein
MDKREGTKNYSVTDQSDSTCQERAGSSQQPEANATGTLDVKGGVWDCSAPVFPALLQLYGAKHI